jgi:soluble lytic murein transglycosylase-like protein
MASDDTILGDFLDDGEGQGPAAPGPQNSSSPPATAEKPGAGTSSATAGKGSADESSATAGKASADVPPAGLGPEAPDNGPGQSPGWLTSLAKDQQEYLTKKGWKTPDDVLKSYRHLEELLGADKAGRGFLLPKDEKDQKAYEKIYAALGRPEKPEDYGLKELLAGDAIDDDFTSQAAAAMHKAGLSKAQAHQVARAYQDEHRLAAASMEKRWEQERDILAAKGDPAELEAANLYQHRADDPTAAKQRDGLRSLAKKLAYEYMGRHRMTAKQAVKAVAKALDRQFHFIMTNTDDPFKSDVLANVAYPKDRDVNAGMRGMIALKDKMGPVWEAGTFFRNAGEDGVMIDFPSGQGLHLSFAELEAVGAAGKVEWLGEGFGNYDFAAGKTRQAATDERAKAMLNELRRRHEKDQWAGFEALTERTVQRLAGANGPRPHNDGQSSGSAGEPSAGESSAGSGPGGSLAGLNYHRIYGAGWLPEAYRERAEPYVGLVNSAAEEYGVPREIIAAVIGAETGWRSGAVSSTNVRGIMQVTSDTYKNLGFSGDRAAPENSIRAGAKLLAQLYSEYGNWPDALRAYNGGPDAVRGARTGNWGIWAGRPDKQREIMGYVPAVLRHLTAITQG